MLTMVLTVAMATAMLVGCSSSGSSGGGSRSSDTITKADYLKKGNAACDELTSAIGAKSKNLNVNDSAAVKAFLLDDAVPAAEGLISKLQGLGTPAGDGATLDKLYTAMHADIDAVKKNPNSQGKSQADPLLKAYGLTSCASNS
jgi:hypothetical protein